MTSNNYVCPLLLNPEDFIHDARQRLGRANGNTYQRRPPVENKHDGQIMVRLQRKRFIIIDYGIVPTEQDLQYVREMPDVTVPDGAGERLCATRNCPRIGVPVQLYDSEPTEPPSLYLRGGLCFSCQRNLNEKRRTQRKRKSDTVETAAVATTAASPSSRPQQMIHRLNGSVLDLNPDAIIINGAIEGTRARGPDYQYPRIGQDLLQLISEIHRGSQTLLATAHQIQNMGATGNPSSISQINGLFQSTFRDMSRATYLITQWKASWDENIGGNMLAAAAMIQHNHRQQMGGMIPTMSLTNAEMQQLQKQQHQQLQQQQLQQQQLQQQQVQQVNVLMAPAPTRAGIQPQAQASRIGEEKNNYDLSDFYEEI
jgi:hypothetical protein